MMARIMLCLIACGLAACTTSQPTPPRVKPATAVVPADWKRTVTRADFDRLHDWREAFVKGLTAANFGGASAKIAAEGALLRPDAALPDVKLPAGRYRCRVIKLGTQGAGPTFTAYPFYDCQVNGEGEVSSLAKLTGSQRPVGLVFDDSDRRQIFLGTMMLGDEKTPLQYGRDAERDMAGAIERVGPERWRLVLPYPRFESIVDVIELTPAA